MAVKGDFIVVSYDIEDDRKRKKISDALMDTGALRVQKSVFECFLKKTQFEKLRRELHQLRGKEDSIRYYFLCNRCIGKIIVDETVRTSLFSQREKVRVV